MTRTQEELAAALQKPFPWDDIEWRAQSAGYYDKEEKDPYVVILPYVTNRAIQERLDTVCGPMNWQNKFTPGALGGIQCGIGIWDESKKDWVWKWDAAANTEVSEGDKLDEDTNVKGGVSASMKRTGVEWGIGRYLYAFPKAKPVFVSAMTKGRKEAKVKGKASIYWTPPSGYTALDIKLDAQGNPTDKVTTPVPTPEKPAPAAKTAPVKQTIAQASQPEHEGPVTPTNYSEPEALQGKGASEVYAMIIESSKYVPESDYKVAVRNLVTESKALGKAGKVADSRTLAVNAYCMFEAFLIKKQFDEVLAGRHSGLVELWMGKLLDVVKFDIDSSYQVLEELKVVISEMS